MAPSKRPIVLKEFHVFQKQIPDRYTLDQFFAQNVVEVVFRRRITPTWYKKNREIGHMSFHRRMLCTSDWDFVFSPFTNPYFKLKKPKTKRGKQWYHSRGLVITFDIMQLDWRMISLDKYAIVGYTPLKELMQRAEFIAFYRKYLKSLPDSKKKHFSDI